MEEDYSVLTSSGLGRIRKSAVGDEEIMELLWQNGQVVFHSQNQRPGKNTQFEGCGDREAAEQSTIREIRPNGGGETASQHLSMQEDEIASWLQYPIDESSFESDLYADLLYSAPPPPAPMAAARPPPMPSSRPPVAPSQVKLEPPPRLHSFAHFSRFPRGKIHSGPSSLSKATTMVDSNETSMVALESSVSKAAAENTAQVSGENVGQGIVSVTATGNETAPTYEMTLTSSSDGLGASDSGSADQHPPPATAEDRKCVGRETDDTGCQSEDFEFESLNAKRQAQGSTSTKRSRTAEVHNQSERRRRDRINEKMKALQELIPRCNKVVEFMYMFSLSWLERIQLLNIKSDKASMLDEAIEYVKSLQLQVQENGDYYFTDDVHGMWHGACDVSQHPAVHTCNGDVDGDGDGDAQPASGATSISSRFSSAKPE